MRQASDGGFKFSNMIEFLMKSIIKIIFAFDSVIAFSIHVQAEEHLIEFKKTVQQRVKS